MTSPHSGFRAPRRPAPIAAVNAAWGALQRVGIARPSLSEASLVAAARKASGVHDFGDESFHEPMRRLLASLESEAQLNPIGRVAMRQIVVGWLASRLRLEQACDLHPEIAALPVEAPVFIAGLQRTGTTLLHRLLSCEPALRALLSWEALSPLPLPESHSAFSALSGALSRGRQAPGRDPRMKLGETAERGLRYVAPEFFAIHPVEAHSPEEDVLLMDVSFISPTADATLTVPSYSDWLVGCDQRPAYRTLRRMIQALLWQRPGRWLGKTPHHLEHIDALLEIFPDAKIIQTHRDPVRVVASFCSMIAHGRAVFSDVVDPHQVGAQLAANALRAVNRSMEIRDRNDASHFLDVHYGDVVGDPLKQIRRIYDFLGLELSPETEQTMRQWQGSNPQHKHGVHRYRLEDFGLDPARLAEQFAPYRERFEIPSE